MQPLSCRPSRRLSRALVGALLTLASLPASAAAARADDAPAPAATAISPQRAAALAVNDLSPAAGGFRLRHPSYQGLFGVDGMRLTPRRSSLAWHWRLESVTAAGRPIPGLRNLAVHPGRRDALALVYDHGAVVEEYLFGGKSIEQRFVVPAPLALDGDLEIAGRVECAGRLVTVVDGWSWRQGSSGVRLGEVHVVDAGGRELPASMEVTASTTRIRIPRDALASAIYPVVVDPEVGPDDFRISDMGGTGNTTYAALESAVAYNSTDNEYLVAWSGDDNAGGMVDNDFEIFAQRIDAATGAEVGANDFRVSGRHFVGDVASIDASHPQIAFDADHDQYLVVWQAQGIGPAYTGTFEFEIFGQLLAADGTELGTNDLRISDMGGTGESTYDAFVPDVAYSPAHDEYLVVWSGDDNVGGTVNEQFEIFAQRVSAAGAEVGANDFRITEMGAAGGLIASDANRPAIAYNAVDDEYLVVWDGDDYLGTTADNELEIFGQRLDGGSLAEVGADDFRISTMGPAGNLSYRAVEPTVAHDPDDDQYLVVWTGDAALGALDSSLQVFGQRLDATGAEVGANDAMLSSVGGGNDPSFDAIDAEVAYDAVGRQYLVTFIADDNRDGMVDGENEVFVQQVDAATGAQTGPDDLRLSHMGPDGSAGWNGSSSSVACGPASGACLVAWKGQDDTGGMVFNEQEVFGQLYVAETLLLVDGFESGLLDGWDGWTPP